MLTHFLRATSYRRIFSCWSWFRSPFLIWTLARATGTWARDANWFLNFSKVGAFSPENFHPGYFFMLITNLKLIIQFCVVWCYWMITKSWFLPVVSKKEFVFESKNWSLRSNVSKRKDGQMWKRKGSWPEGMGTLSPHIPSRFWLKRKHKRMVKCEKESFHTLRCENSLNKLMRNFI